jgi:hypothetical protein
MNRKPFITTYLPVAGWKAVHYWWNPEGFWEPWDTSMFAFGTEAEAAACGMEWARAEEIRFVPRGQNPEEMP